MTVHHVFSTLAVHFPTSEPILSMQWWQILGVRKTASSAEAKQAYH